MVQASRRQVNEANLGVSGQVNIDLNVPTSPREEVNFHNIWASLSCEPETAGANCQGTWVLWVLKENSVNIIFNDVNFNTEVGNAFIIACGVFGASNESPFTHEIHPQTSRTLQAGDRLRLSVTVTGITADLASTRGMLCAHTTRK